MRKELICLLFLMTLLFSCEEVYHPDIDTVNGQLVVEARITNELSKNFVHLSRTRSFYDRLPVLEVTGAAVELIEMGGPAIRGIERTPGFYSFNSVPVTGKSYFLRFGIQSDIYESSTVTMPPPPAMTNFAGEDVVNKVYITNGEGVPQSFNKQGREFHADLPVTSSLAYYRFDVRTVWEWFYDAIPNQNNHVPTAYGWYVYHEKKQFNLAGPKSFSQTDRIEKHPLLNVSYNVYDYIHADTLYTKDDTLYSKGWILVVDQYGTSKESFEFHKKLNDQFSATGNLFDPVQTQVYGNIMCKTNHLKTAYGFFDLNSYQQYRYYFYLVTPPGQSIQRQLYRFPEIPDEDGMEIATPLPPKIPTSPPPDWWE